MTVQDTTTQVAIGEADDATASAATLLERLTDRLGGRASVSAVFGEPVTCEGVTVIPVARVGFGFGGGSGHEVGVEKSGGGAGGGGGVDARPLGFIEIANGTARYRPIHNHWIDVLVPVSALLAAAGGKWLARAITARKHA
ncbi:spore germination protein GerW family protein [Nocardia sp. KC 131]|uniref:spore germination protein GerW family protein n=1 Tax=Nocardia arseniciresistens TaxID=3392119 RepID=UPI00398E7A0C